MLHNRVPKNSDVTGTQVPKEGAFNSHKEPSAKDMDKASYGSKLNNADLEKTLRERVLDNSNVARAALFDKEDALQVAGSVKQFDISQEQTRELLDALLSVQREVEGTNNTVTGAPPKSVQFEGASYSFANKTKDCCTLTSDGKPALVLVQSARTFLIAEGAPNANVEALQIVADSWSEGLATISM